MRSHLGTSELRSLDFHQAPLEALRFGRSSLEITAGEPSPQLTLISQTTPETNLDYQTFSHMLQRHRHNANPRTKLGTMTEDLDLRA